MRDPIKQSASSFAVMIAVILSSGLASAQEKKLTLEELIAQHLESIGSVQARAFLKNRVLTGSVKLVSRVGEAGVLNGDAAIAFSGVKLRYSMRFPSPQYPGEQLGFDGSKVLTGFLPGGRRSGLSLYLEQQNTPLRDGLLGGTLSTGWTMLRLDQLKPQSPCTSFFSMANVISRVPDIR